MNQNEKKIIPSYLAVKAMRDNGFKTSAHALAELIDNSIQAEASSVEVFCIEEESYVNGRSKLRITSIGVLDNGCGMKPETLSKALQFGNGTHLQDRKGIGRFGMGLPNSSISQCRKVEVWTWQNGHQNAIYSYLDVHEIEKQKLNTVPEPQLVKIPEEYVRWADELGESGTLVLWTGFEENRLSWKRAQTIFKYTEFIIGRMYRKFIDSNKVEIRMQTVTNGEKSTEIVRVNDPLYLTDLSSTPKPFDKKAMFQPWPGKDEKFEIEFKGQVSVVTVRISWASEETLTETGGDRGNQEYGKHAEKNIGVSIVREKRELDLDRNWAINYDPRERWWGIEVEFPATLDEIFGVTNNKQAALIFSQMANYNWKEETELDESYTNFLERLEEQGDPKAKLLPIAKYIRDQLGRVRKLIKEQGKGIRTNENNGNSNRVEVRASNKFHQRKDEGHKIDADQLEPNENDREAIKTILMEGNQFSEDEADEFSQEIIEKKLKVLFTTKHMGGEAFFNVQEIHGGITTIEIDIDHPLFENLISTLNLENENDIESESELRMRIEKASETLKLLFASWARYEKEEEENEYEFLLFRNEWGIMAKYFLT